LIHVTGFWKGSEASFAPYNPALGKRMNTRKPLGQRTAMDPEGDPMKRVAKLGSDVKAQIGQKLRVLYGGIVNQGVPGRFDDLLKRLDDTEQQEGGPNG
jgi:hypothetical protein